MALKSAAAASLPRLSFLVDRNDLDAAQKAQASKAPKVQQTLEATDEDQLHPTDQKPSPRLGSWLMG